MQQPKPPSLPVYRPVSRKGQEMLRAADLSSWAALRQLICSIVNSHDELDGLAAAIERFSATRYVSSRALRDSAPASRPTRPP